VRLTFAPIDPRAWPGATALAEVARRFIAAQLFAGGG
jgi:hypothetical protein